MIFLQIAESVYPNEDLSSLEQAAQKTLLYADADQKIDLTIVISDDEELRSLNRQFLEVDAPTDVLSFPADEFDEDTGAHYLGDVIISYSRAVLQAKSGGHPVEDELCLLTVHGVLHLLGYDHMGDVQKVKMWDAQAVILEQLGCSITIPSD